MSERSILVLDFELLAGGGDSMEMDSLLGVGCMITIFLFLFAPCSLAEVDGLNPLAPQSALVFLVRMCVCGAAGVLDSVCI